MSIVLVRAIGLPYIPSSTQVCRDLEMRSGLLSDHERDTIQRYLNDGLRLNGFAVLKHLCQKYLLQITDDLDLIHLFLRRAEEASE